MTLSPENPKNERRVLLRRLSSETGLLQNPIGGRFVILSRFGVEGRLLSIKIHMHVLYPR